MQEKPNASFDRRTLLKGGAVGAAALGLALSGCGQPSNNSSASGSATADEEFDFIICGAGAGGAVATLTAAQEGLNVVVLEKTANFGGDLALSGGIINYQTPEILYDLLMKYSSDQANPTIAKAFADNCKSTVDWLIDDQGIPLNVVKEVTVGHEGNGPGLAAALKEKAESQGVDIRYNTRAVKLLVDENSTRVTGVIAVDSDGAKKRISATKGVLLATGSYGANAEMMQRYLGTREIVARGLPTNVGDGHEMALEVRAALINMGDTHGSPINPEARATFLGWYQHGIVVNRDCERFIDEMNPPTDYCTLGKSIFKQPGGVAYAILDNKWHELVPEWNQNYYLNQLKGELVEANTIAEMGEKLGLDPTALQAAVDNYNNAIDESNNTAMSLTPPKTGDARKLVDPPFIATALVNGSAFTYGGMNVNGNAQALDLDGNIIPGLYGSGRMVGGLYYDNYVKDDAHGASVGDAMVFGRLAALHAAS